MRQSTCHKQDHNLLRKKRNISRLTIQHELKLDTRNRLRLCILDLQIVLIESLVNFMILFECLKNETLKLGVQELLRSRLL